MIPENIWISKDHVKGEVPLVNDTGIAPKITGMANVQRRPTIPMTKRDSLVLSGSRLSLISVSSNTNPTVSEDKKQANTHSDMVAARRRSPKKVKRTDSYKKALNRQSQYDNVEDDTRVVVTAEIARRRADDKQKYNTLPVNTAQPTCNGDTQRKKRPSGDKTDGGAFQRNASQKSGTYPSPDTDEDQRSIQPQRIKKSAFKKFKERFMSSVKRDRENQEERKHKKKAGKIPQSSSKRGRVRPNITYSATGFHTPNGAGANDYTSQNGQHSKLTEDSAQVVPHWEKKDSQESVVDHSDGKKKGFFTSLRNSFRRKQHPAQLRPEKKYSLPDRPSSNEIHQSPKGAHISVRPNSSPIDIPARSTAADRIDNDDIIVEEDGITAIFGSIIDPSRPTRRPDRSKLRLEGLRKNRPKSFDRGDGNAQYYGYQNGELSPTVEIDGLDFADGPTQGHSGQSTNQESEDSLSFIDVVADEKQKRIDEVAQRLAALGDKIVADRQHDSAASSSDIEGHRVGLSSFERSLLRDLHHYADMQFGNNGGNISISLMPTIKSILAAQDYSKFKHVIQQELSHTNGWEQVAWYTCLIKATVCVAESGVGTTVSTRAKKYFNSVFRPWIESKPNGWESIVEETDIDSELD